MKTLIIILTALSIALLNSACQQKPKASFDTVKNKYNLFETVYCSNNSTDASSLVWVVKGPQEFRSNENSFAFTPSLMGSYEINLSCYSKNNKHVSKVSKTITVTNNGSTYSTVFYTDQLYGSPIELTVDGVYQGDITYTYTSAPSCGAAGCVTLDLTPGNHTIAARFVLLSQTNTSQITVRQGACNTVFISY